MLTFCLIWQTCLLRRPHFQTFVWGDIYNLELVYESPHQYIMSFSIELISGMHRGNVYSGNRKPNFETPNYPFKIWKATWLNTLRCPIRLTLLFCSLIKVWLNIMPVIKVYLLITACVLNLESHYSGPNQRTSNFIITSLGEVIDESFLNFQKNFSIKLCSW